MSKSRLRHGCECCYSYQAWEELAASGVEATKHVVGIDAVSAIVSARQEEQQGTSSVAAAKHACWGLNKYQHIFILNVSHAFGANIEYYRCWGLTWDVEKMATPA